MAKVRNDRIIAADISQIPEDEVTVPWVDPFAEVIARADAEELARAVKAVVMICFPSDIGRKGRGAALKGRVDTAFLRFAALAFKFNADGMDVRTQREYARLLGVNHRSLHVSLQRWERLLDGCRPDSMESPAPE